MLGCFAGRDLLSGFKISGARGSFFGLLGDINIDMLGHKLLKIKVLSLFERGLAIRV